MKKAGKRQREGGEKTEKGRENDAKRRENKFPRTGGAELWYVRIGFGHNRQSDGRTRESADPYLGKGREGLNRLCPSPKSREKKGQHKKKEVLKVIIFNYFG